MKLTLIFVALIVLFVTVSQTKKCKRKKKNTPTSGGELDSDKVGEIINGQRSRRKDWPWHVIILRKLVVNGEFEYNLCGGSILNNRWILTAAHCLEKKLPVFGPAPASDFKIAYGRIKRKNLIYKNVANVKVFNLNRIGESQDIGLIQTQEKIIFSDSVKPVNLMNESSFLKWSLPYNECYASGFGSTEDGKYFDYLRHGKLNVLSEDDCNKKLEKKGDFYLKHVTVCAFSQPGQNVPSPCDGDSGGAWVCKKDDRWVQVGIESFGYVSANGTSCSESIATRVATYYDWIMKQIK